MENYKGIVNADATETKTIGSIYTDDCIVLRYTARRGGLCQYGKIIVMNKHNAVEVTTEISGDDIGLTITGSVSGTDMLLSITADSSDNNVTTFNAEVETKKL